MCSLSMEELNEALDKVRSVSDLAATEKGIISILNIIENEAEESNRRDYIKCLVEGQIIGSMKTVLSDSASVSLRHTAAQLLAEIAKTDVGRDECVNGGVTIPLLDLLSSSSLQESTQACRALGNICFDNDIGRHIINDNRGVDRLLDLLRDQRTNSQPMASKLRKVACGFLFNLVNTHGRTQVSNCNIQQPYGLYTIEPTSPTSLESIRMITLRIKLDTNVSDESVIEKSLSLGVIAVLNDYIQTFKDDEDLVQMVLLIVEILADCEHGIAKILESNIVLTIGQLLSNEISQELQEIVLDMFINLSENDDVKLQLVNSELFQFFLDVMKKPVATDDQGQGQLEKLTSDLIILLLTGDSSMELLYDGGRGPIMKVAPEWMKSSSSQLQISGALAIGNIARTDGHCIELEKNGLTDELLNLLDKHLVKGGNATLHHAILSALRNLAIPAANKPLMLGHGLIERILPYACSDMRNVQFKLLGTLRMVIDQQENAAITLGTNDSFVSSLVEWCSVEDHEGVKGEANRLVAWLVKHSRSTQVMHSLLGHGALPHIVNMVSAEHAVMQNEALVALTLISVSVLDSVAERLVDLDLLSKLKSILMNERSLQEIVYNVLSLIKALLASSSLQLQAKNSNLIECIQKFEKHDDTKVESLAKTILAEKRL